MKDETKLSLRRKHTCDVHRASGLTVHDVDRQLSFGCWSKVPLLDALEGGDGDLSPWLTVGFHEEFVSRGADSVEAPWRRAWQ